MKIKFDITGAVKKTTGYLEKIGDNANIDAHLEIEFGADELGTIYDAQRALVPEVLSFIKEMQQLTNNRSKEENKITDLERNKLETRIGVLEVQLRHQQENNKRCEKDKEFWKSKCKELLKGGEKQEDDDNELY